MCALGTSCTCIATGNAHDRAKRITQCYFPRSCYDDFGGMLFKEHSSHALDYIPVGGQTLTTIDVAVRDSFGEIVPLHGSHLSSKLLFAPSNQLLRD